MQEHQKAAIIMAYNATKGGEDNLDKLLTYLWLQKDNPTLATGDILHHLGCVRSIQHNPFVLWMDGVECRLKHREAAMVKLRFLEE